MILKKLQSNLKKLFPEEINKINNLKIIDLLIFFIKKTKKNIKNIEEFFMIIKADEGGKDAEDCIKFFFKLFNNFFLKFIPKNFCITNMILNKGNLKKVIFKINYCNLYYIMNLEHGINRIIRFSPFKKQQKIQTSFVDVSLLPYYKTNFILKDKDLLITSCRSTGAGGQHVNKTNSAVSIIHKPTKIQVKIQTERSYHQNLIIAKKFLIAKINNYQNKLNKLRKENILNNKEILRSIFFTKNLINDHVLNKKIFGKKNIDLFFKGEIVSIIFDKILYKYTHE